MGSAGEIPGRRERKLQASRSAIFSAAHDLFFAKDFDSVTVAQIADRADLGVGTLFYHACSKTELFLMVYNTVLAQAMAEGEAAESTLPACASVSEHICALALPIARLLQSPQATNLVRYHRDLLFGDSNDTHRRAGIDLVRRFETHVADVLAKSQGIDAQSLLARHSARAVFAALHFDIALPATDLNPATRFASAGELSLRMQIEIVVQGFCSIANAVTPMAVPVPVTARLTDSDGLRGDYAWLEVVASSVSSSEISACSRARAS